MMKELVSYLFGVESTLALLAFLVFMGILFWLLLRRYAKISGDVELLSWFSMLTNVWTKRHWYLGTFLVYFAAYAICFRFILEQSDLLYEKVPSDEWASFIENLGVPGGKYLAYALRVPEFFGPTIAFVAVFSVLKFGGGFDRWLRSKIQQFAAIPKKVQVYRKIVASSNIDLGSDVDIADRLKVPLRQHFGTPIDESKPLGSVLRRYTQFVIIVESWKDSANIFHDFWEAHRSKIQETCSEGYDTTTMDFANALTNHEQFNYPPPDVNEWEEKLQNEINKIMLIISAGLIKLVNSGESVFSILSKVGIEGHILLNHVVRVKKERTKEIVSFSIFFSYIAYYFILVSVISILSLFGVDAIPDEGIGPKTMIVWPSLLVAFLFSIAFFPVYVALRRMEINVETRDSLFIDRPSWSDCAVSLVLSSVSFVLLSAAILGLSAFLLHGGFLEFREEMWNLLPFTLIVGSVSASFTFLLEKKTKSTAMTVPETCGFGALLMLSTCLVLTLKRLALSQASSPEFQQIFAESAVIREVFISAALCIIGVFMVIWSVLREYRRGNNALPAHIQT
jgi:hypothetical protein